MSGARKRNIGLGLERIGLVPIDYPYLSLALMIAFSIFAAIGVSKLKVDDSLTELFRADTPEFRQYETLSQRFPSSEFDVLMVVEGEELLKRENLDALRNLVIELQFIEAKRDLISLFSAREPPAKDGAIPPPLFPADLPEADDYPAFIKHVQENQIIRGKLLSEDGKLALIVIALDPDIVAGTGLREVIEEIENTTKAELAETSLKTKLSGAPVMQLEIRNAVERDRLVYNGLGFLIGALIAIIFFRRFSLMVIAAAPPALAILWSLGILGWLDFRLNLFLSVMSPLIMVMAFSDTMQITFSMRDKLIEGASKREALRYAILTVGPACVVTDACAAASFITLLFSDSALIRTFGMAGAISTFVAYIAVIAMMPLAGMFLIGKTSGLDRRGDNDDWAMDRLRNLCQWIADYVTDRPVFFASLSVLLLVIFGTAHLTLEPRYRLADQVPDKEQALDASSRLDKKLTGANPIHIMVELAEGKSLYTEESLQVIRAVHELVESQKGVGNVWSVETLRRWLEEGDRYTIPVLKQYVEMLPSQLTRRFIAKDEKSLVIEGRVPDIDASQLLPIVDAIDAKMDPLRKAHAGYKISVTGLPAIAARNSASMISQLNWGLTGEMVFVAALIGLAFRSVLLAFVSALPGLFPIFASGTLLALSGEGMQFASIVALTVAFGLGLDATIHYLNRLQLEDKPGEDPYYGVKRATVLIGPALMLTTIVLAFGLAVTIFSDLPSLRLFGRLAAITLIAALIGDLMILPSVILLVRRYTRRHEAKKPSAGSP